MITKNKSDISRSEQIVLNRSMDDQFEVMATEGLEYIPANGANVAALQRKVTETLQMQIIESGTYTYICLARVGTPLSDAYWQIKRIDASGNIMYADANENFDNIATDPTSLSYSYS
jgi:hypothetical protein